MNIREQIAEIDPDVVLFEDLDAALLGLCSTFNQEPVACYDRDKCVEIFMGKGMTHDEAVEWMEFNVLGLYCGARTPVFLLRLV